ncbi:MAG TPA: hypothetical protein VMS93_12180 [Candidatus Saccharimonadales bacterium]|nr:hypothetical protein [Candidatus Saccharimonadales bacterium]
MSTRPRGPATSGCVSVGPPLPAAAGDSSVPRTAVIVCHGMGQQVPFETLEGVARALREAEVRHQRPAPPVTTRMAAFGGLQLPRAELRLGGEGGPLRDVHLYEAYWAPLTEGRVSLRDVLRFLLAAGWSGVRNVVVDRRFDRWMFGHWQEFPVPAATLLLTFAGALLEVLSLTLMGAVILVVTASHLLAPASRPWPGGFVLSRITLDIGSFVALAGILAAGFLVAGRRRRPRAGRALGAGAARARRLGWFGRWGLWTLTALAGAGCLGAGALVALHLAGGAMDWPWQELALPAWVTWLVWAAALGLCAAGRWFLVEYVGDVAAYVSAHTVSKFDEVRDAIQKAAMDVAGRVYRLRSLDETAFAYARVVMVGHSLGSVVAYDTLDRLVNEDATRRSPARVVERTGMLLTFGSPLDKTAFIFRTQRPRTMPVREAQAAAKQPLIVDYRYRPARWVNIYSREDIISGCLRYYDNDDEPEAGIGRRVENRLDPDARTPLMAHNEYWDNPCLGDILHGAVTA